MLNIIINGFGHPKFMWRLTVNPRKTDGICLQAGYEQNVDLMEGWRSGGSFLPHPIRIRHSFFPRPYHYRSVINNNHATISIEHFSCRNVRMGLVTITDTKSGALLKYTNQPNENIKVKSYVKISIQFKIIYSLIIITILLLIFVVYSFVRKHSWHLQKYAQKSSIRQCTYVL